MPVVIKEIVVRTIVEKKSGNSGVEEQQLRELKREILREVRGWMEHEKRKEQER
ncbi:MAG: hypothetical protein LUG51_09135 [Tannerellaceae bacterium]|nr:hypothetical protein [Tannerellaceae bacterium]